MARQLIEAIRNGDQSLARNILLSDKYGCIDCQTARRDGTALFWACAKGFLELVQLLIAKGANVNARTNYNSTPLIAAADSNRHHVVRLLIESGADLNAQTTNGDTACHQAAYRGHVEAVRLLVSHGADVDVANTKFRTPYDEAARQGHLNLLPFLDGSEKAGPNRRTGKLPRSSSSSSSSSFHRSSSSPSAYHQHQQKAATVRTCGLSPVEPCQSARRDSCDCLSHDSLSRESSYEDCGQAAVVLNVYDLDDRLQDREELVFGPDPERFFPPPPPSPSHHLPPPASPLVRLPPPSSPSSSSPSSRVSFPESATLGLPRPGRRSRDMSFSEAGGSGGGVSIPADGQFSFPSGLPFTYSDVDTNDLSLVSDRTNSSKRNILPRLNIPA